MRRIVVTGGSGFFGRTIVQQLRGDGFSPLVASRRASADLVIDVEDRASLSRGLRPGDVVVDAVGPFQQRSTKLAQAAIRVGFDLVDIADSLAESPLHQVFRRHECARLEHGLSRGCSIRGIASLD